MSGVGEPHKIQKASARATKNDYTNARLFILL